MEKILSFIIPSYNSQKYLDKVIPSLLEKSVIDKLDIIIVNDGSTDDTITVATKYCEQYPDSVRLITQENKGHGGALNTGCAEAKGKYLKVIDADDWIETQNLPKFIEKLENCDSDVVLTHHYTINVSTNEINKWMSYPDEFEKAYSFDEIMKKWDSFDRSLTFHGITYNTEFYHKYGMQLSEHVFYEDHEFATVPCCYAKTITPIDMFIYDYRIGDVEQSVSDVNQLKRLSHIETVLNRLVSVYEKPEHDLSDAGKEYLCMKTQGVLLAYIKTVLLVEKNKKLGRQKASEIMEMMQKRMPMAYELSQKQHQIFTYMNQLHISKSTWEKICHSKLYNKIRHGHDFN